MKRIFVTGASGFIGRNFLELYGKDFTVSAPGHDELPMEDTLAVERYFLQQGPFDLVLHLANTGGKRNSPPQAVLDRNIRMFNNLLRCRRRYDRMIFLGSGAEYGKQRPLSAVCEDDFDSVVPHDDYGLSKYLCSKLAASDAGILNLRIFGVFGPYEDESVRFISNAVCRVLIGEEILIRQDRVFDYTDVRDLCAIIRLCIDRSPPFPVCNAGSGRRTSLTVLADLVRSISGDFRPVRILIPGEGLEYSCDNSLLKTWAPDVRFRELEESVRYLYEWYARNKDRIVRNRIFFDG